MSTLTIGIVDYGVGNLGSVHRTLCNMGYRCRVSYEPESLSEADLLLLPGVGSFPNAMQALHEYDLVDYLQKQARSRRPIIGICLGMQLLADVSVEFQLTAGLGLIPGQVSPLPNAHWHTGWNTLEVLNRDELLQPSDGQSFYFNHSFVFEAASEHKIGLARLDRPLTAAVRHGSVVGLQFHPEKSQIAGQVLLRNAIEGLCGA
jgi:glutamine amidotransferase